MSSITRVLSRTLSQSPLLKVFALQRSAPKNTFGYLRIAEALTCQGVDIRGYSTAAKPEEGEFPSLLLGEIIASVCSVEHANCFD